jgi:hypothetical protein
MGNFHDDRVLKLVPLAEPRPLSGMERELVNFLLDGPLGRRELRDQATTARVASACSCGCPSIGFDVDPSVPKARFRPEDTPLGRTDWIPISAVQHKSRGTTEVTLHILEGRIYELEVWAGNFGIKPRVDLMKLERDG